MISKLSTAVTASLFVFLSAFVSADGHKEAATVAPLNVQVQLCSLLPGKTMAQYNRNNEKYFAWAKKNDVEVTFVRSTPLLTHANGKNNPVGYDFFELLASDYETSGKAWDLWISTPEGQKLNAEWQSLAKCDVKMASLYRQWADMDAIRADDNRITTWNWCTRKEGVSSEQLTAKHRSIAAQYGEGIGNIGWFTFYPLIGGAGTPGEFAHVVVYPDVAGLMEHQEWFSKGGWKDRQDYHNYADCQGESAVIEEVRNRPESY